MGAGASSKYGSKSLETLEQSGIDIYQPEDFEVGKYIAEGGYGKVYVGVEKKTQTPYALKFFGYNSKKAKMSTVETEIDFMHNLQGINGLVKLIGVMIDSEEGLLPDRMSSKRFPVIIMELLRGGELYDYIAERDTFSEQSIAKIFKGIVITMDEMHQRKYLHRDVKLENLMFANVKDDSSVKIIDFGLMVKLKEGDDVHTSSKAVGSRGYMAPESITSYLYSPASDVWQAGCTLYMLLSGCFPFDPRNTTQVTEGTYYRMSGIGWDVISSDAKNLVRKLLVKDPLERIKIKDILKHPWLVNEAPSEDLGQDYFARLKHLVLCQKLKGFFNGSNIRKESVKRRSYLMDEMPLHDSKDTEFDSKLKILKESAIQSFKHELSFKREQAEEVTPPGELNFDGFLDLLNKVGLSQLGNRRVFNIFDSGNTGSVDMKDFLLTLIAFKMDEEMVETGEGTDQQLLSAIDDQCRLYFNLFDIGDTGVIELEELKLMMQILFKDQQLPGGQSSEELFKVIDLDENGLISYDEFKKFYDSVLSHTIS